MDLRFQSPPAIQYPIDLQQDVRKNPPFISFMEPANRDRKPKPTESTPDSTSPDSTPQSLEEDFFASDPTVPPPAAPPSFASKRPFRILIADDNAANRKVVRTIVERLGYEPIEASNGKEAFAEFKKGKVDFLFTDIDMPEMDGIETAIAIRAHEKASEEKRQKAEIIAVTANPQPETRSRCRTAGMNGFLEKPVDEEAIKTQLLASWKRVKRRNASP